MPSINALVRYDWCDETCSVDGETEETYHDTHGERSYCTDNGELRGA